ncbi:MAG: dicarboxylate/amino acid:cation symporter [Planctomycetota bacterium]|nr:dicarboxylate/amino acid:cation symporter [Planctomycetota bacterium]
MTDNSADARRNAVDRPDAQTGVNSTSEGSSSPPVKAGHASPKRILIGLALGAGLGLVANFVFRTPVVAGADSPLDIDLNGIDDRLDWFCANIADVIGKLFLRLMFMVVLPLVVSALALAVVEIGDLRKLGRIGVRTLAFSGLLSACAVLLGLSLVNLIKPGASLSETKRTELVDRYAGRSTDVVKQAERSKSGRDIIVDMIPENPLQEMVGAVDGSSKGNGMLAVMFFALFLGAAIAANPEKCGVLIGWLEGLNAVAMVIIGWAMVLAPLGAGFLVFSIVARLGFDVLITLFWFALTVLTGLLLQLVVVYPIVITLFSRFSPLAFFRGVAEAMEVAFGTSSSNATLPTALRVAEDNLKLPRETSRFVLTVGATGNQNGTALYEGVVVLFLAQVFGVELTTGQQLQVVLMSILAGIGTAGVPGGSLPLIVVLMRSVGVPGEGIGIIFGVDRILDMCRTVLNVTGDLVVATCVAGNERAKEATDT